MNTESKHTEVEVRGVNFKLLTFTRSLELCARMNYETENLDFIDEIPAGAVLYDLGACEGRFSIYAAKKGIRVYAFEPEAKNFSVLTRNLSLNEITDSQVSAVNAGVGWQNGNAFINIGQPWEGGHQKVVEHGEIRSDLNFNFVSRQEIKLISIDAFIADGTHPFPDYLKVDIDGSEMPFLKGASETLKNNQLKGIIFELNEMDPNFGEIIRILANNGFTETTRHGVPNEPDLYNIVFARK